MLTARQYELALAMSSDPRMPRDCLAQVAELASAWVSEAVQQKRLDHFARYVPDLVQQFREASRLSGGGWSRSHPGAKPEPVGRSSP